MSGDMDRYRDIIDMPHHVSKNHPPMGMAERAAQFSPFAALAGHDAAIREAARLTSARPDLDEGVKQEINAALQAAMSDRHMVLAITYFVPDSRKEGGSFAQATGRVRKVQAAEQVVVLDDGTAIPVGDMVKATPVWRG